MIDWRFLAGLVAITVVIAAPAWRFVGSHAGGSTGLAAGLAFSFVSLGLGFHWIRWSVGRGNRHFTAALLGGTLARIIGLMVFALAVAYGTNLNLAVALVSAVTGFFLMAVYEIIYLHRTGILT